MRFFRRRTDDPRLTDEAAATEVGATEAGATEAAESAPTGPEPSSAAGDAGWEPDPADFDDPVPEAPAAPAVPAAASRTLPVAGDLGAGLQRTRGGFMSRLRGLLGGTDPGGPSWDEVEETLIAGDVGASLAIELVERARARRDPDGPECGRSGPSSRRCSFRAISTGCLARPFPVARPSCSSSASTGPARPPRSASWRAGTPVKGHSVILAAADTFRAAAIEQLRIWADRAGVPVVAHAPGADPGAVVYDALDAAVARRADIVIADTAGRLHTRSNLMDELAKVRRIVDKRLPGGTPETLFVLDATTGQNGLAQAKAFHDTVGLTGIVLTKLDSTAKGGIVFAIEHALGVPVRFVGVGEGVADLIPFDPDAFVAALFA